MDLSIKSIKENWNKKSTAQKASTVAAGVAATAAVATAIAAGVKGKVDVDAFVKKVAKADKDYNPADFKSLKFTDKIKYGFEKIGNGYKKGWEVVSNGVKNLFSKKETNVEEVIEEVVEDAQ